MSSLQADAAAVAVALWTGPEKNVVNVLLFSERFAPVAGTEGGSGEMSGRLVPLGCARVARGKTPAWLGWTQASATWGRAPPGLRVGGQLRAAIRGRGAR